MAEAMLSRCQVGTREGVCTVWLPATVYTPTTGLVCVSAWAGPGEGFLRLGPAFPGPKESGPAGLLQGQEGSELPRFLSGPALVLFLGPGVRAPFSASSGAAGWGFRKVWAAWREWLRSPWWVQSWA